MNNLELNQASKALDPATEQLIHKVVSALLKPAVKGECRCHWLDPTKTPILAWKSAKDPNTLVLKISTQKFIGLSRSDKNNELYWKFRDFYEGGVSIPEATPQNPKPTADLPTKEIPAVEVERNSEDSEAVKKFREKFGEFSAKQKYGTPNSTPAEQ